MSRLVESLEDRRLLSATLVGKVLTIAGTDNADRVLVLELGTKVVVNEVSFTPGTGTERPTVSAKRTVFNRSEIESVSADLKGGNDQFAVSVSLLRNRANPLPVTATGGAGNDVLRGGFGADTLDGGEGNDLVSGGAGNDIVRGGAGNDRLGGDAGDDTVEGGDGRDHLVGGRGTDILRGGAGNDTLISDDGAATDTVDGGDDEEVGGDLAFVDKGDTVTNVERTFTLPDRPSAV